MALQHDVEKVVKVWDENDENELEMGAKKEACFQSPKQRQTLCPDQCKGFWQPTTFEDRGTRAEGAYCVQCGRCRVGIPY